MRELGKREPLALVAPASSRNAPIEAAWPNAVSNHIIFDELHGVVDG